MSDLGPDLRPARPTRHRPGGPSTAPVADDLAAHLTALGTHLEARLEETTELLHAVIDRLIALEAQLRALEPPAAPRRSPAKRASTKKAAPAERAATKPPAKTAAPRKRTATKKD